MSFTRSYSHDKLSTAQISYYKKGTNLVLENIASTIRTELSVDDYAPTVVCCKFLRVTRSIAE